MIGKRHFGILLAGLLLSSQAAAASGSAETSASLNGLGALSPSAVFAAFESNLAVPVLPITEPEPTQLERMTSPPERLGTFEIAAALALETEATFKASLAASNPQALTPPSLSVTPDAIRIDATVGGPTNLRRLSITSLGGTVNWRAQARMFNASDSGWLRIFSPDSTGTVEAGTPAEIIVEINPFPLGTTGGLYQGEFLVTDEATGFVERVPVALGLATQAQIGLSQSSMLLTIAGGGAAPPPQTLVIYNKGTPTLNWSIPASEVPSWLSVSPLSGTSGTIFGAGSSVTLSVNAAEALALSSGVYQAELPIQASGASNSPQLLVVTLQRVPGSTPASAGLDKFGTILLTRQGAGLIKGDFTVLNRGGGSLTMSLTTQTFTGGNWLSPDITGGTIDSASGPLKVVFTANPGSLPVGLYSGNIRLVFSNGDELDHGVVLVLSPPETSPQLLSASPPAQLDGCTPDQMVLISESIGNGLSVPISFPRVLVVTLVDSCGEFVDDATVVASVEGSTIALQGIGNGIYNGTWVPQQQSDSVAVRFAALHPTLPPAENTVQVSTEPAAEGILLPVLANDGVVEAAGFTPRRPLAPGGFISLFGSRFTTETAGATQIPLERELAGVRVKIGGIDAPLHFVSPGQINAQFPVEFVPGANVSIVVNANGVRTAPQSYFVAPAAPGIFIGPLGPAILRFGGEQQGVQVTAENPVRIGDILEIFATGLGPTDPPVASGEAGPAFSTVLNPVSVEIGGIGVPVLYQGLAPGFVGLYQVNVQVTDNVPIGDNLQIRIIQNGVISNSEDPATVRVVQP